MVHYNKHTTAPSLTVAFTHKSSESLFPGLDCSKCLNILLVDYVSLFLLLFPFISFSKEVGEYMSCFRKETWSRNHIREATACNCLTPHFLRARLHQKWANLNQSYSKWQTVDGFLTLRTCRHFSLLSHSQRNLPLRHTPASCEWAGILQLSMSSFYTQISMGVVTSIRPLSLFSLLTRS